MTNSYARIAFTPSVKQTQELMGTRSSNARLEASTTERGRLGPNEAGLLAARDGFFLSSVSETGWPYVQFRGGPTGFLRVLDERTLAWADFRGNRQYISVGDMTAETDLDLFAKLDLGDYRALVERAVVVTVEGFDWNCPQHITPRFTEVEIASAIAPIQERLAALEAENAALRRQVTGGVSPV